MRGNYLSIEESSPLSVTGRMCGRSGDKMDFKALMNSSEYDKTDTVIYTFNKLVKLLLDCNPNTCEILGLDEEQYLIKTDLGQELIDNSGLFLSKRAIKSFGGYADAQLRRLQNAIAGDTLPQSDREKHFL